MADRDLWSLRIDEAQTRPSLQALDAQLVQLAPPWAGPLRLKIAMKLARLKDPPVAGDACPAASYGIAAVERRPLYEYRLSDEAFARLQDDLARKSLTGLEQGSGPALFVLWASEWFRRSYRGGGHRWIDLARALNVAEDQELFRRITQIGLATWGRRVRKGGAGREYLGSLAREGGFPAAAVEDKDGWASALLKAIVAPLLAEPAAGEERAQELATMQRHRLPQLFADDEFLALCGDLALAVVRIRREADAPAAAAGLPVGAWLTLHRPGWQDALPLRPGDRAGEGLVDGLLKVEAVVGAAVGVDRYLLWQDGCWSEAARVVLSGTLDSTATRGLDRSLGRQRVFAAGEMARYIPGELAMLEAPGEGEKAWTARATKRSHGIHRLPFAAEIALDLRSGEQRVARIPLGGGKPRRGALIVTEIVEGDAGTPTLLRVIGSGSGKYRADMVVVQAPGDWRVETTTADESIAVLGPGTDGQALWRVTGGAFVIDPIGDTFRILCGQPQDEPSRIELIGDHAGWAETSGNVDLYVGPVLARIGAGDLCWRAIGTRAWSRAPQPLPVGHYDLGWRRDRVLLDRRRVAVLPAGASVTRSGPAHQPIYHIYGFQECCISPDDDAPVRKTADGSWRARPASRPAHWLTAHVKWPEGPALAVRINHPTSASIARWDGSVLPNQVRLTLGDLNDLVAVHAGTVTMVGELHAGRRVAEMTWEVVEELPMASIAADVASLLLPSTIDAEVRLGMHDGIETWWRVRQFAHELTIEHGAAHVARGLVAPGAELVGRAFASPAEERSFGPYSLYGDANHRPVALPMLDGEWLVYLRAGNTVLSRPKYYRGAGTGAVLPTGALGKAMMLPPGHALDNALLDLLAVAEQDDAEGAALLAELLALIATLRGLPPVTFRVLELLVRRPGVLARLAVGAPTAQRDGVMTLSDALPFAWCLIPHHHWQQAQGAVFGQALQLLTALGADAPRYAMEILNGAVMPMIDREPLLGPVLKPGVTGELDGILQSFLNRAADRIQTGHGDRYRGRIGAHLPRAYRNRSFDPGFLDTLDAPWAAAAAVHEHWTPQADDIRHIKTVARTFPTFFADAFAASLSELS